MRVPRSFCRVSDFPPSRHRIITFLLLSAFHTFCISLRCQTVLLKDYTTRDGLPDSRVAPILQDKRGYIWFGTQAGLTRYDGKEFVNFGPAREIPGIFGRSILEDYTGALWFACSGFSRGAITRIQNPVTIDCTNGLAGMQVYQVAEDPRHDFWAATSAGLEHVRFSDSTRRAWTVQTLRDTALMMVHADTDGGIWYAGSKGLFRIEEGKFAPVYRNPPHNPLWHVRPYSFYRAHDGSLWLGGYHGAYRLAGSTLSLFSITEGLPERGVWCFREDMDGTFFVGTMNGLYRLEKSGAGFRFTKDPSFGDAVVYDMCLDREGNLWFASAPGLRRLIRSAEIHDFPGEVELANAGIGPIEQDGGGTVYLGSRNTGLYALRGTVFTHIGSESRFLTRTITSILPESGSRVWVALWRTGVYLISPESPAIYTEKTGLPSDNVHALTKTPGGGIIAGTAAGVVQIKKDGSIPGGEPVLPGKTVFDLKHLNRYPDGQYPPGRDTVRVDTIWAGTNDGVRVLIVNGESISVAPGGPIERETAGRIVYVILADTKGRIWFGTDGAGVLLSDADGLSRFTREDGLAGDRVFALAEDSLGNIWIGTSSGLSCYNGHGFRNLGYDEGFGEIGVRGLMTDSRGFLWVSAYPGVKKLKPVRFPVSNASPPLYLTDVQVDSSHLTLEEEYELQPDPAVITFRFAALSYSDERCVRYRYRLDGFDREWSQPEVAREVRYTHLPSGRYKFRVLGRSGDGVWNETPAAFSFAILPPLWARWWFIACGLTVIAGSIYATYRYRLGKIVELERTRSRIAMDLHDDIGSSLTRISVMTEVAGRQRTTDPEASMGTLARVGETARELIESLSDIVWTVDPKQDNLQNVIRRISQFGQEMCEGRGIGFETDLSVSFESIRLTPEKRRDIYLVFKEGIHNIVKHSGATRGRFSVHPIPHGALLELLDDGTGIPDDTGGSGHGLRSLRERGERAGVKFSLTSKPGEGTHIQLEVKTG
jgi:ligand-binding sensor domain-containing protein/signal transduction histidine kinase